MPGITCLRLKSMQANNLIMHEIRTELPSQTAKIECFQDDAVFGL